MVTAPKAIIFDMDGLMFDTERLGMKAWLHIGEEMDIPITEELVLKVIGLSWENNKRVWYSELGDFDIEKAGTMYHNYVNLHIEKNGIPMKSGLLEILSFLEKNKIKKAIASSSPSGVVKFYMEKAGITGRFDAIVSGEAVSRGKPEPDIFLHTAGLLGVAPGECVVLEDSINGIKAAYAANMIPVMIPDLIPMTPDIERLLYAKTDSLNDAIPLLKAIIERK